MRPSVSRGGVHSRQDGVAPAASPAVEPCIGVKEGPVHGHGDRDERRLASPDALIAPGTDIVGGLDVDIIQHGGWHSRNRLLGGDVFLTATCGIGGAGVSQQATQEPGRGGSRLEYHTGSVNN